MLKAVLGIDAAWTLREPSGVALVTSNGGGWRLQAVAPSYLDFLAHDGNARAHAHKPRGSVADASLLLSAVQALTSCSASLVAIDMPLSHQPITARRVSDNKVSTAYGARQCGTHTPSAIRPGAISDELTKGFALEGFPLLTTEIHTPGLIEVYPHPALVELTGASKRLPYKHGKIRKYWPSDTIAVRRTNLIAVWRSIIARLDERISGVAAALPIPNATAKGWEMKGFEDMLDAVICAWVGICALDGDAIPFGDANSAIWIPKATSHAEAGAV